MKYRIVRLFFLHIGYHENLIFTQNPHYSTLHILALCTHLASPSRATLRMMIVPRKAWFAATAYPGTFCESPRIQSSCGIFTQVICVKKSTAVELEEVRSHVDVQSPRSVKGHMILIRTDLGNLPCERRFGECWHQMAVAESPKQGVFLQLFGERAGK